MDARSYYLLFLVASCLHLALSSPCYDHQPSTYAARFKPTYCRDTCSMTPFFSPDHSLDTYVSLIQSATKSIDIYTPGFDSWVYCTHYKKECDGECIGCDLATQRNESFPVFPALLNAVHQKGVQVRLITNNYTQPTCPDKITPLDWFYLNGIDVRFYTTTTFMHSKFVNVDGGKRVSVSSVNWSKTSFTKNREAGVVFEDCSCSVVDYYKSVFDYDWSQATEYVMDQTYSASEMKYITDPAEMSFEIPPPPYIPGAYMTSLKTYDGVSIKKAYTSPDNARDVIMSYFSEVKSSLQIMIYQVTDAGLCNATMDLWKKGINVTLLVSDRIVSYIDWKRAQDCYTQLYNAGMNGNIRKTFTKFEFSHQKFWIIDNEQVHLSTGNWSPSDFPSGSSYLPYSKGHASINRDLLVVMESPDIVKTFQGVFNGDWSTGKDFVPKKSV